MDEITLTRELGRETPLPSPERLAPARALLLAEITPKPSRKRWVLAAAAVVVAAAVAVPALTPKAAEAPESPAMVPAGAFLIEAAEAVAQDEDAVPRPDQYIYTRFASPDGNWTEVWNSVDGEHDNKLRYTDGKEVKEEIYPGCVDGKMDGIDSAGRPSPSDCEPLPAYRTDLPTDPKALVSWLEKRNLQADGKTVNIDGVAKEIWELTGGNWLRPAQRATFYRAVGLIDGIMLVPDTADGAGRVGVGVAWTGPGEEKPQIMWIIDPKTYAYLGGPKSAIVEHRIVDRIGQRS